MRVIWHVPLGLTVVRAVVRAVCRMFRDGSFEYYGDFGPRCRGGGCGFGGFGHHPNCPEFVLSWSVVLAAEREAEQEARAAFWRLWKTPYERVKRVRPRK